MRFSERYGYKSVREIIQIDSMDKGLRNKIWSLLKVYYWDKVRRYTRSSGVRYYLSDRANENMKTLCQFLWFKFFKEPLDTLDDDWKEVEHSFD